MTERAGVEVRPATEADVAALTDVYNEVIRTSDAIWLDDEVTVEDRLAWLRSLRPDDACLVATDADGTFLGYAACFPFRDKSGYWPTVELTIMVASSARGTGVGTTLLQALIDHATAVGRRVMVAGTDAANLGSIRLHERFGFREVARMPGVGRKRGRPVDLVLLQLDLPGPDRRAS
ncbi:MAG: N-acetyltransferase family protein [Acidimicrobiales bacterium]